VKKNRSLEIMSRGDEIELVVELFAELILVKGVKERLIELFFV
jgi:hypothetical protein